MGQAPFSVGHCHQRKPIHAQGEHANSPQKGQGLSETFPTLNFFFFIFCLIYGIFTP